MCTSHEHAAEASAAEHVLSLNLVRNSAHKEFFENSLRSRLRRLFRHPGNDLGQAHLYKRWKEANPAIKLDHYTEYVKGYHVDQSIGAELSARLRRFKETFI